jgi:hypothetical protein
MGKFDKTLTRAQAMSALEAIARKIDGSGAITNAIVVATKYGDKTIEVGHSNTHETWTFEAYKESKLSIRYQTGTNVYGHTSFEVHAIPKEGNVPELVLSGSNHGNSLDVQVDKYTFVSIYHPGRWEKELAYLARNGPRQKKPKKNAKKDSMPLSERDMQVLKASFGSGHR